MRMSVGMGRLLRAGVLVCVIAIGAAACKSKDNKLEGWLEVKRVVDGDTFWVKDGTEKGAKIRLIGVDTPETVHPRKPVEYYGREASDFVKSKLKGKKVRLEFDVTEKDRYGRYLAYVYLEDGTFLNAYLVENGYAKVMTVPPNVKYADEFVALARKAREAKKGLWAKE